jgi:hypothetical protein
MGKIEPLSMPVYLVFLQVAKKNLQLALQIATGVRAPYNFFELCFILSKLNVR